MVELQVVFGRGTFMVWPKVGDFRSCTVYSEKESDVCKVVWQKRLGSLVSLLAGATQYYFLN